MTHCTALMERGRIEALPFDAEYPADQGLSPQHSTTHAHAEQNAQDFASMAIGQLLESHPGE